MTTFFVSDTHFGHARILELCNRPFKDVTTMNEMLVHNWNALVRLDDTVYHLGDVALGPIEDSLKYIMRLNGRKILVVGNHDRMFPPMAKGKQEKIDHWTQRYIDAGFDEVHTNHGFVEGGYHFRLSHFPYDGDHTREERYAEYRQADNGVPLIHGHTHDTGNPVSFSRNGTFQYHVGVDAHDFAPVPLIRIIDALDELEKDR